MYTDVVEPSDVEKSMRIPISGQRLAKWERMLADKNIGQQQAIYMLIDWIVEQDEIVQSMVLKQISPQPDLVEVVLRRLAAPASRLPAERPRLHGRPNRGGGA